MYIINVSVHYIGSVCWLRCWLRCDVLCCREVSACDEPGWCSIPWVPVSACTSMDGRGGGLSWQQARTRQRSGPAAKLQCQHQASTSPSCDHSAPAGVHRQVCCVYAQGDLPDVPVEHAGAWQGVCPPPGDRGSLLGPRFHWRTAGSRRLGYRDTGLQSLTSGWQGRVKGGRARLWASLGQAMAARRAKGKGLTEETAWISSIGLHVT